MWEILVLVDQDLVVFTVEIEIAEGEGLYNVVVGVRFGHLGPRTEHVGNVVGKVGKMPKIYDKLMLKPELMQRVVGMESKKQVENLRLNEPMMLVVGTAPTVGVITRLHGDEIELALKRPVVAEKGQRIAIGRRVENKWRLIGYAEI